METLDRTIQNTQLASVLPTTLFCPRRSELRDYFINTWNLYEQLFGALIVEEAFYFRADPLRHPLIFYYGHTAAFYINKFRISGLIRISINWHFELLFSQGVDPDSAAELQSKKICWPSLDLVRDFRFKVYRTVLDIIDTCDLSKPINSESALWALMMGIEHDRIHLETSSVLIRQLPIKFLKRPDQWHYAPTKLSFDQEPSKEFVTIKKTTVELGKRQINYFGWDNEYGHEEKTVDSFKVSKNLVTNDEFLEFVNAGGYHNPDYWSSDGWKWRISQSVEHPRFWVKKDAEFHYRAMFDILSMPHHWPVEANYYEAAAYCKWRGEHFHIMDEDEYRAMTKELILTPELINKKLFNINLNYSSPTPVGYMPGAGTINDLYGNVWEWIDTKFRPFNGFVTHPLYLDFSVPYFTSQYIMMLGGSWVSSGTSALSDYRLWFRRNFYQHCGFRLVSSVN